MYCFICGEKLNFGDEGTTNCSKCGTFYNKQAIQKVILSSLMNENTADDNSNTNALLSESEQNKQLQLKKAEQLRRWNERANAIVSVYFNSICFIMQDGSCHILRRNDDSLADRKIENWRDIRAVAVNDDNIYGLKGDGTVLIDRLRPDKPEKCSEVRKWNGLTAISADRGAICGLRYDGTVLTTTSVTSLTNNCAPAKSWKNIIKINVGYDRITGVMANGTIKNSKPNDLESGTIGRWTNMINVIDNGFHIVGIDRFGNANISSGYGLHGEENCRNWTDIISAAYGHKFVIGLKSDGTAVAAGQNNYGQCDVSEWSDIIAVYAGFSASYGLRSNGTFEIAGENEFPGLEKVKLFDSPDDMVPSVDPNEVEKTAKRLEKGAIEIKEWLKQLESEKAGLEKELSVAKSQMFGKRRAKELEAQISAINMKILQINASQK